MAETSQYDIRLVAVRPLLAAPSSYLERDVGMGRFCQSIAGGRRRKCRKKMQLDGRS